MVVGRVHDLFPQVACRHLAVDPQAVFALEGAFGHLPGIGFRTVDQFDILVLFDGFHEHVGDANGNIEIGQVALVFGVDEILDVRMVTAQHAHLRAAARAGGFDGFAGAVEHAHVRYRAAGVGLRALDLGALGPDRREVITDAAAAAHGFGGFLQRDVDAGFAIDGFRNGVPDRLHKTVDQRGRELHASGGVDAARRDEAIFLRLQETFFPDCPLVLGFGLGQCARHAAAHLGDAGFLALGVFLDQRVAADFLLVEGDCLDGTKCGVFHA